MVTFNLQTRRAIPKGFSSTYGTIESQPNEKAFVVNSKENESTGLQNLRYVCSNTLEVLYFC